MLCVGAQDGEDPLQLARAMAGKGISLVSHAPPAHPRYSLLTI